MVFNLKPTEMRWIKAQNKAGYTVTLVACGWAGAVMKKVIGVRKSKMGTDQQKDGQSGV